MASSAPLKLLVIGDSAVGKTCLLLSYTQGAAREALSFDEGAYAPTVFDTYEATVEVSLKDTQNGTAAAAAAATIRREEIHMELYDTSGSADYDRLRPISYASGPDVVMVCYSAVSPASLEHAADKWIPELQRQLGRDAKFLLVGCQCDAKAALLLGPEVLRIALGRAEDTSPKSAPDNGEEEDEEVNGNVVSKALAEAKAVDISHATKLGKSMGATTVLECSAKTGVGLQEVLDAAVSTARGIIKSPRRSRITGLAALELHPIDLSSATETPSPDVGFSGKRRLRGRRGSLSNSVSPMRALSLSLSGSETPGSRRGGSRGPNVFDELDAASTELLSILRKVVVKQGDGTRRAASIVEVSVYGKYNVRYVDDGNVANYIKPKKIANFFHYNSTDTIDREDGAAGSPQHDADLLLRLVKRLLKEGADVNAALEEDTASPPPSPTRTPPSNATIQPRRRTPLYWAAASGAPADVLELLIQHGAEAKGIDLSRYAPAPSDDKASSKILTPQARSIALSMAASEDEHPLLSAAVEVWRLEAQLKQVLNKRGVRRNADGRLRMASSASPRRNRSRRASLSSDMSSSSSSDTDGSVSVVLGPVGDEQSSEKQKKTTEKHRHTNGGGRWGSDTASPDLPLPLHRPGSSETKSLRVQALLAGQTDYIQANRRPPPSSPSLNLQVKTTSNSVNMHNAELLPTPRANKAEGWRSFSPDDKFASDDEDEDEGTAVPVVAATADKALVDASEHLSCPATSDMLQPTNSIHEIRHERVHESKPEPDGEQNEDTVAELANQCVKLVETHVAEVTQGGKLILLLRLHRTHATSLVKFPPLDDAVSSQDNTAAPDSRRNEAMEAAEEQRLLEMPRCIAVYEASPASLFTHKVEHARSMLEAQGPLSFSANDDDAKFAPKKSFDSETITAPVELQLPHLSCDSQLQGMPRGVIVAKMEISALLSRLQACDPRFVGLLRGVGATVVSSHTTLAAENLVQLVRDDKLKFAENPSFALTLGNMTRGLVRRLRAQATPAVAAQRKANLAVVEKTPPDSNSGLSKTQLKRIQKKAAAKARRQAKKNAAAQTHAALSSMSQASERGGETHVEEKDSAAPKDISAPTTKPSNRPSPACLKTAFPPAELRAIVQFLAAQCLLLAELLAPKTAMPVADTDEAEDANAWKDQWRAAWGKPKKMIAFRLKALVAFQRQVILELRHQTLIALGLADAKEKDANSWSRDFGSLDELFRRWEEACSVDRRMPAMQGLEDALARSKRRETLNGWHSSFRQMSMQRFAKRYWKLQQSPRGRSPSRRRRRSAGNKRPSAWSPAGNGSVGSPGVSPHRRKSDTALAAAQVAALFSTTSSMDPDVPDSKVAEFSIPAPTPELERLLHELDPKSKCLSSTEVVFATQVGSAMYNLATSASDEDYLIVFVKRPTLDLLRQEATSAVSAKKKSGEDEYVLHPEGDREFGSAKDGVVEGKAVELSKYVADLCKGNPMGLEPLLLHCAEHPEVAASSDELRPVQNSWVWREFAQQHALRCLRTRRCLLQYAGFVGDRLYNAKAELVNATQASLPADIASARRKCSKYLYHALHKLSCLEDAVSGKCPSVFVPRNSPVHEHIMRVRLCDSLLDLQLEIATAETRLSALKAIIDEAEVPDEVDFDALANWLLSVRMRIYEAECQQCPTDSSGGDSQTSTFNPSGLQNVLLSAVSSSNEANAKAQLHNLSATEHVREHQNTINHTQPTQQGQGLTGHDIVVAKTAELVQSLRDEFGPDDVDTMLAMGVPAGSCALLSEHGGQAAQALAYYFSHMEEEADRIKQVQQSWIQESSEIHVTQQGPALILQQGYDPENHISDVADFYEGWSDDDGDGNGDVVTANIEVDGELPPSETDAPSKTGPTLTERYDPANHITDVSEFYDGWSDDETEKPENAVKVVASSLIEGAPTQNGILVQPLEKVFSAESVSHPELLEFLSSSSLQLPHLYGTFIRGGVTSVADFAEIEGGVEELVDDFGVSLAEAQTILNEVLNHGDNKKVASTSLREADVLGTETLSAADPNVSTIAASTNAEALSSDDGDANQIAHGFNQRSAPLTPRSKAVVATENEVRAILKATEDSYRRQLLAHRQAAAKELDEAVAMAHQAVQQTQQAWAGRVAGLEAAHAMQKRENRRIQGERDAALQEVRALRAALQIANARAKTRE